MSTHRTIIGVIKNTCTIAGLLICFCTNGSSQSILKLNFANQANSKLIKLSENKTYDDSLSVSNVLIEKIDELREDGYLASSVDRIGNIDSQWVADVYIGQRFSIGSLQVSDVERGILEEANFRLLELEGGKLSAKKLATGMNKLVKALSNNGYPFASAQLKSTSFSEEGELEAKLEIVKGKLILIDSLNVYGGGLISSKYLEKYLDIEKGDRYNEEKILDIRDKIKQLPFLNIKKNPTVTFFNDEAVINLDLLNKNASRFDFIIGLLQNEVSNGDRFTLIYDFSAQMMNKLGTGEQLFLQFKRLKPEVQELDARINYPYLLNLPFGIDFEFSLYRNADTNLDLDTDIGIQYFLGGNNFVKASWEYYGSNLLDIDTSRILRSGRLPDRLDVSYNAIGLTANFENLDYRFNPKEGFAININSSIGLKSINENQEIKNLNNELVDFTSAYDTLNASGFQVNLISSINYYFPIGNRSTIKTELQSGLKVAEQRLYQNELFRLGGNRQLRGFDEQSVFSDFYNILTLEYRLLLGENSYLSTFADYGFVRNELLEVDKWDRPFGIGAGLNFETGAGIFGISTAVGKTREIPLNFRNAKIHFGYISVF